MLYVGTLLVVIALILTIMNGAGRPIPLWVAVLLLCIASLIVGVLR